jgi:hypothetical protein
MIAVVLELAFLLVSSGTASLWAARRGPWARVEIAGSSERLAEESGADDFIVGGDERAVGFGREEELGKARYGYPTRLKKRLKRA